jgi:hypothetical protein
MYVPCFIPFVSKSKMPVAAYPFRFTQSLLADRSFRKKSLHEPWLLQPSGSDSETDEETRGPWVD